MSVVSSNPRPAHGISTSNNKANQLLGYMKLRAPSDPIVYEKISKWVESQKAPIRIDPINVPTCRVSSALLLQRLVRAFENRLSSSSDDVKKTKVSNTISNRSNPSSPTNGNFVAKSPPRHKNVTRAPRKLAALSVLMQRKVKVTRLVQEAVQFVGSDVLKVLQVSIPSPTVADVANACLDLLSDEKTIKLFYLIFKEALGKGPSDVDEASPIYFGVFALQALQSLRAQAIFAYEFSHDFEMIYRTCYQNPNFQICLNELNPSMKPSAGMTPAAFAPDTEARNICWKLARLLALKFDYENKSYPEAKDHRRNHILYSATSIIIAANIGKSVKNGEITTSDVPTQIGIITDDVDFVTLVSAPVSELLNFLETNTSRNQGITPISKNDIRSHVMQICNLINQPGIAQRVTNGVASSSSNSLFATAFSPRKDNNLVHDYRKIIQNLVVETQKELKINTAITNKLISGVTSVRTGIVNVLLFFPMVIGEPWGIHRDAPMISSKMLCSGENSKPSDPLEDSVAVVLKLKPRPKVIKRKSTSSVPSIPFSIRTGNKKAKTISLLESPKRKTDKVSQEPIDLVGELSNSPAPRAPIHVRVGEIEAPTVNDSSELNEWTLSILSLSVVKPSDTLLTYLGDNDRALGDCSSCLQDVIVPVLNRGVLRIQNAICSSNRFNSEVTATQLSIGRRDGQVYVNGGVDKNIGLCASIVGFYYYSLEAIIQDQMEKMDFLGSIGSLLQSGSFHRALLACCYTCVLKGVGINQKLNMHVSIKNVTVQVIMDSTESDPFTLLKVIEAFSRALIATKESIQRQMGSPIVAGLPFILYKHAQKIEAQLIDSVLWNTLTTSKVSAQNCFTHSIKTMKSLPGAWPPDILEPMLPEEIADIEGVSSKSTEVRYKPSFGSSSEANFISFVLRKLLNCIFFRIRAMCAALKLSNESALHTQILVAFRYLLRHQISIFSDRHVDQLLLCTIYGICRVMEIQPKVSFGKIIDAYFTVREEDQGDRTCRIVVRHVKLASPEIGSPSTSQVVGNIVVFYNTFYVPKMQNYFLGSKSLKKTAELYQMDCKKEEMSEEKRTSEKKNSANEVPNTSSNLTSGEAAATNTSVATRRNDSNEYEITVDLTDEPTSLNDVEKIQGTNGVSPDKSSRNDEANSISSPSKTLNRITGLEGKAIDGKSPVVEKNSASAGAANDPEKSNINFSKGQNELSTSSIEEVSSPADKPSLPNGTNASDLLSELDEKKVPLDAIENTVDKHKKKNALPNGTT